VTFLGPADEPRLRVVLDLRHPLCFLALGPTAALCAELGASVDWLPMSVPPLRPPTVPGPEDDRGTRHRRARALALAREIETYARAHGLVVRDWYRDGDVTAARLGWLWMRAVRADRLPRFLETLFRSYWAGEIDGSETGRISGLVAAAGGDEAAFLAWSAEAGPEHMEHVDGELRSLGVHQVPAYLTDGEVFYGRQHLPLIRWILDGRRGPPPV